MAETDDQITAPDANSPVTLLAEPELSLAEPELQVPPPAVPRKRSGFFGPLIGGVIAAGAGFGVAQYVPDGWPIADTTTLQATLEAQAKDIAALKDQIAQIPVPEVVPAVDLAPLSDAVAALGTRLAALEANPAAPADTSALADAVAKVQADIAALQTTGVVPANVAALTAEAEARLQEAEAQAAQIKAEAEALASTATARAALGRLEAAINSGGAYAEILPELGFAVPEALQAHAETGLPSLTALQNAFPPVARAALEASLRANMGDSWTERATSFFRSQTGARSLTPLEGNDPDAVLSRAEAALAGGDLAQTMSELDALPDSAQAALTEWRALAEQRQAATKALQYIAGKIGE